jgi:hypothetical protein
MTGGGGRDFPTIFITRTDQNNGQYRGNTARVEEEEKRENYIGLERNKGDRKIHRARKKITKSKKGSGYGLH